MAFGLSVRLPLGVCEKRGAKRAVLRKYDPRCLGHYCLQAKLTPALAYFQIQLQPRALSNTRALLSKSLHFPVERVTRIFDGHERFRSYFARNTKRLVRIQPGRKIGAAILQDPVPFDGEILFDPKPDLISSLLPFRSGYWTSPERLPGRDHRVHPVLALHVKFVRACGGLKANANEQQPGANECSYEVFKHLCSHRF